MANPRARSPGASLAPGRSPSHAIPSYSIKIEPADHFWQQDPYGNFLGRVVVLQPTDRFSVTIDLMAEMTVINAFDFFLESDAEYYPFSYSPDTLKDLMPFLHVTPVMEGSPSPNMCGGLIACDGRRLISSSS